MSGSSPIDSAGFLMPGWEEDQRHFEQRLNAVEREIASHKAVCEERHKEIQRRFEHADEGRSSLRSEMTSGFGELRGRFDAAHNENRSAITRVERGGLERSFDFAKALLLVAAAGALGYFLKGGH